MLPCELCEPGTIHGENTNYTTGTSHVPPRLANGSGSKVAQLDTTRHCWPLADKEVSQWHTIAAQSNLGGVAEVPVRKRPPFTLDYAQPFQLELNWGYPHKWESRALLSTSGGAMHFRNGRVDHQNSHTTFFMKTSAFHEQWIRYYISSNHTSPNMVPVHMYIPTKRDLKKHLCKHVYKHTNKHSLTQHPCLMQHHTSKHPSKQASKASPQPLSKHTDKQGFTRYLSKHTTE
ncbi:uncharacterized protein BO66DRAFT_404000 [Aspergillus aculeatinus CBS 121060]|uniref:Uncharacterized protein n=1 Tax=Aspergillus aculeatinus CBS 121060 TaxID=1448322 RepID=A0ACD1H173_9EURO|nr:hypothetical protein BO66DRAFT_404000 [Aspergillus aculeatinus CBS 121060]RAH67327.1 hypothetical protein BO66DRAFT_404000 [Aspergillus aculeatinus CBS 121060]